MLPTPNSILEDDYNEPTRPYSQKELEQLRYKTFRSLRLGEHRAEHSDCSHYYNVKVNGRKEKEIKESGDTDVGNCSVCWRLSKTPKRLQDKALDLIDEYMNNFHTVPTYFNYYLVDTENTFYRWLYYG